MKIRMLWILASLPMTVIGEEPGYYEESLPNPAISVTKDENGAFVEVVVNEWHDSVHTQQGRKNYIYRQGFNYHRKEGFVRVYTPDMTLVVERYAQKNDGMVVREEMLQAFEIFKADPTVGKLLADATETVTLFGGFGYVDKQATAPCYYGNRCVHVMASTPSTAIIAHAIVKLVDQSVPYPTYDTDPVIHQAIEAQLKNIRKKRGKQ